MKLEYDPQVDAAYITLVDGAVAESEEIRPGIVIDVDAINRVVGVEILNIRKQFPDADLERLELQVR